MPEPAIVAAHRLADVLALENAALLSMDLRRATMLLPEKSAAIAELAAAGHAAGPGPHPDLLAAARRLNGLALENRHLLRRAIVAQRRVIGILVRAALSVSTGSEYGTMRRRTPAPGPMALSTRA